jgi:hypothetical protein
MKITLSKSQWQFIGKQAGWMKTASLSSDNWDRFKKYIGMRSWDEIVETGEGRATTEEQNSIIHLGYYDKEITQESINGLKNGVPYKSGLRVLLDLVEGFKETKIFKSKDEMSQYVKNELQDPSVRNVRQDGFGTDYYNATLETFTMKDLGIDIRKFSNGEQRANSSDFEGYEGTSSWSNE